MTLSVNDCANAPAEIAAAVYPEIRFLTVPQKAAGTPVANFKGEWKACSPETARGFSAAAYYFGRELYQSLKVPVGLIHSSVGGTAAEVWTIREALSTIPKFAERADKEIAQWQSQPEDNNALPEYPRPQMVRDA